MNGNYMYGNHTKVKSKKTIIMTVIIIALLAGAVVGATAFFKGDDTAKATTNVQQQIDVDKVQEIEENATKNDLNLPEIIENTVESTEMTTGNNEQIGTVPELRSRWANRNK